MRKEKVSQEFRLKNIDKRRNYFAEEIELMSTMHKKVCTTLNYTEYFLILASAVTVCISISFFPSLVSTSKGVTSSPVGFKICGITAAIIKYLAIMKKKKKKHDKIVLSTRTKLNSIEIFISSAGL